jgi:hypothetical protein
VFSFVRMIVRGKKHCLAGRVEAETPAIPAIFALSIAPIRAIVNLIWYPNEGAQWPSVYAPITFDAA